MTPEINLQIREILENNQLEELKIFLQKHKCFNRFNLFLVYFFHIVQSAGILVTTVATGYNQPQYIWLGVGLNIFASLLNVFEKTNHTMMTKLTKDIQAIKDGIFLTETPLVDLEESKNKKEEDENKNTD
jgi:hypothetical protein